MKLKFIVLSICCLILTAILCSRILTSEESDWLLVETSSSASYNIPFNIKVTLLNPPPGLHLSADIHSMDKNRNFPAFMAAGKTFTTSADNTIYEFSITVPHNRNASYIFPVIILSEDGTWKNRISASEGEAIPVTISDSEINARHLKKIKVRDTAGEITEPVPDSYIISIIISVFWISVSLILIFNRKIYKSLLIPSTAALSSLWEFPDCTTSSVKLLRIIAHQCGIYGLRQEPQQILSILTIVLLTAFLLYLVYSADKLYRSIPVFCLSVFWSISFLRVLSLHEIDTLFSITVAGIPAAQVIRLASSSVSLASVLVIIFKMRK